MVIVKSVGDAINEDSSPNYNKGLNVDLRLKDVKSVAEYQLCSGCGACAFMDPKHVRMVDDPRCGRRPVVVSSHREKREDRLNALKVCPGVRLKRPVPEGDAIHAFLPAWGVVNRACEGHALDEEIRYHGSSGGAATALALHCLKNKGFTGVLHTAGRSDIPYLNETVVSVSREDLLKRTGSRYAPSSPCDGLQKILDMPGKFVFIGKPCDVAAMKKIMNIRPDVADKIGLTIAFFCAGVPSTQGTLDLMKSVGVEDASSVTSLRYRGQGWPGRWKVHFKTEMGEELRDLSYLDSWKFLSKHKQWRCNICPDHVGEYADIAVGDPWYRTPKEGELGSSLILSRTKKGLKTLEEAAAADLLHLEEREASYVFQSHPSQPVNLGMLFGRLLGLRLVGVPVPIYQGFRNFGFWVSALSASEKYQSIIGASLRVLRRGLFKRKVVLPNGK